MGAKYPAKYPTTGNRENEAASRHLEQQRMILGWNSRLRRVIFALYSLYFRGCREFSLPFSYCFQVTPLVSLFFHVVFALFSCYFRVIFALFPRSLFVPWTPEANPRYSHAISAFFSRSASRFSRLITACYPRGELVASGKSLMAGANRYAGAFKTTARHLRDFPPGAQNPSTFLDFRD